MRHAPPKQRQGCGRALSKFRAWLCREHSTAQAPWAGRTDASQANMHCSQRQVAARTLSTTRPTGNARAAARTLSTCPDRVAQRSRSSRQKPKKRGQSSCQNAVKSRPAQQKQPPETKRVAQRSQSSRPKTKEAQPEQLTERCQPTQAPSSSSCQNAVNVLPAPEQLPERCQRALTTVWLIYTRAREALFLSCSCSR